VKSQGDVPWDGNSSFTDRRGANNLESGRDVVDADLGVIGGKGKNFGVGGREIGKEKVEKVKRLKRVTTREEVIM